MYTVRPPFFLKWYYPMLTWQKSNLRKNVYLTFDDGPIPNVTPFVLKTLKNFNIKATFFCIGNNIDKNPEIFEQIKAEEHQIGNHTYNHLKGWNTEDKIYLENYDKCQKLTKTNLFRPPYGRIRKSQAKALHKKWHLENIPSSSLEIVMWDVLSGDFDLNLSPEQCYLNVIDHTRNGSIIVFHDSLKAWDRLEYALPKSIEYLLAQGFNFEKL